jgi:hypothetical protein
LTKQNKSNLKAALKKRPQKPLAGASSRGEHWFAERILAETAVS